MRAPTVRLRVSPAVLVAGEVMALAAFVALAPARFGWWPAAVIAVVLVAVLSVTVHGRNAAGWVAALPRWQARRRNGSRVASAVDVAHGDVLCGVRTGAYEAVTMLRVHGRAYAPTFLRGSSVAATTNLLTLGLLAELLDQPGMLRLAAIDVVSAGARVRSTAGYPPLYSTLLADRPAAGRRSTHLILRLDLRESVPGLAYRSSVGAAAAAATERVLDALLQDGIRAAVLTADELDAALAELGAGLVSAPIEPARAEEALVGATGWVGAAAPRRSAPRTGWTEVVTRAGHLTSYYLSPEDVTSAALNQVWALRSDEVVVALSLCRRHHVTADGGSPVLMSAMVRTTDPQRPAEPPLLHLNPLPGDQFDATLWAAPTERSRLRIPALMVDDPDEVQVPIGPTGILVGAALRDDPHATPPRRRDDWVTWSLTDSARATRIVVDASDFYVRQLLVRAVAVGERVAIHTGHPRRWASLAQPNLAVVTGAGVPDFVPTIVVNDGPGSAATAGLAATVITLGPGDPRGPAPDLRFVQTSEGTVRVSTARQFIDLAIVAFRQEQAWTG